MVTALHTSSKFPMYELHASRGMDISATSSYKRHEMCVGVLYIMQRYVTGFDKTLRMGFSKKITISVWVNSMISELIAHQV